MECMESGSNKYMVLMNEKHPGHLDHAKLGVGTWGCGSV
jgi:hypothetical protein